MKRVVFLTMVAVLSVSAVAHEGDETLGLFDRATVMEHDLRTRFLIDGQVFCGRNLPTAERDFVAVI